MFIRSIVAALAAAVLSTDARAANQVFVVDPAGLPGGTFATVQAAVDAAGPGDLVLVVPGTYAEFVTIDAKTVALIGDTSSGGSRPAIAGFTVKNVGAAQHAVVRGFTVGGSFALFAAGSLATIDNCAGSVIVEDVDVAAAGTVPVAGLPALRVINSAKTLLTRCLLAGPAGQAEILAGFGFAPGPGLVCTNSALFLYDTSASGGAGADAQFVSIFGHLSPSQAGAAGAVFVSGTLFASGSTIAGGAGGDGFLNGVTCVPSSSGGSGVDVGGALTGLALAAAGGAAGVDPPGCPQTGAAGAALAVTTGSVTTIADVARSYEVTTPIHEGQVATTTVTGVAGENVVLLLSFAPNVSYFNSLKGALIGAFPLTAVVLGVIPPGGVLTFPSTVAVGSLPPSFDGVELFEQVLVGGAAGTGLVSSPTAVAIVK